MSGSEQCCYRTFDLINKDVAVAYVTPYNAADNTRLAGHPWCRRLKGLPGWRISPSRGLWLRKKMSTERTHTPVPRCGIHTSDPRFRAHKTVDVLDCTVIVISADDRRGDNIKVCANMTSVMRETSHWSLWSAVAYYISTIMVMHIDSSSLPGFICALFSRKISVIC
jgi:hypothetical protein